MSPKTFLLETTQSFMFWKMDLRRKLLFQYRTWVLKHWLQKLRKICSWPTHNDQVTAFVIHRDANGKPRFGHTFYHDRVWLNADRPCWRIVQVMAGICLPDPRHVRRRITDLQVHYWMCQNFGFDSHFVIGRYPGALCEFAFFVDNVRFTFEHRFTREDTMQPVVFSENTKYGETDTPSDVPLIEVVIVRAEPGPEL